VRRSVSFAGVLAGIFAFASTTLNASGAGGGSTASSDTPADRLAYLIGTWNCSIKLTPAGSPAVVNHGVWTFTKSQSDTIHAHWAAPGYEADDYYGYDAKTKTYWLAGVDTQGVLGSQTSKDDVTFTGSFVAGGVSSPDRDIVTRPTPSRFNDLSEVETKGAWSKAADMECIKT